MSRTILIVEDIESNREILKKILGPEYRFLEAENGQEGMQLLHRSYKFLSAVLLDLSMPIMDGFEMLRQIRSNAMLSQLPVIVMTGSTETETEEKALSQGANDYIVKPYNPVIVRQRIHNTIVLRETSITINSLQRDRLTGLFSREAFFERVVLSVQGNMSGFFTLACINIDNFKVVNDQYGTEAGDAVLRHVANCIRHFTEEVGGICCRMMADCFAALYPSEYTDSEVQNQTRREMLAPLNISRTIHVRVGRYVVDDLTLPPSAMYDRASLAERSIKGKYGILVAGYNEAMRAEILREQEIVSQMNDALRDRQFHIYLQPQYNHATGALIGAEALVRWLHPEKGVVSPGLFIPIFEQNGFIYELDKYVWEETCSCLRRWIDEGRNPLPVSVNISRFDIFRADLVDVIVGLVERYDLPTELLRLEITESAFAKSTDEIVKVVKRLISFGFTLEIDDFGSGYSSLNTLKSVPAQVLKLDMRFLDDDGSEERGGNILESIVRMAKWIGMSVIAEGVEEQAQADFLQSIGCTYIQGYFYARPMPVADYEALCRTIVKEEHLLALETVENLDNDLFWNPKSVDTLIFNSYVGSACICEYYDGRLEVIRSTKKFIQMVEVIGMPLEDAMRLNWLDFLDDASYAAAVAALQRSIDTKEEQGGEYVFCDLPGCQPRIYLHTTLRVIAMVANRCLVYCIHQDVTGQRLAEQKALEAAERLQVIMKNMHSGITAAIQRDGVPQSLFTNDRYYELIGYTRAQFAAEVKDPAQLAHPDDRAVLIQLGRQAIAKKEPVEAEYRVLRRDGSMRYLHAVLSTTGFIGVPEPVQLGVFTDITAQKQTEMEIRETDDQLHFLNEAAREMLEATDSSQGITLALQRLLEYFRGDLVHIFEYYSDGTHLHNTYEVCAEKISSRQMQLQNVSKERLMPLLDEMKTRGYLHIPGLYAPGVSDAQRDLLESQGMTTLLAVPLQHDGALVGLLGVHNPRQHMAHVERLTALGSYISLMLARRDLSRSVSSGNRMLANLMNGIPGGFATMRLGADGSIRPVLFDEGFQKLVDTDLPTLMRICGENALAGVHPDDIAHVRESVNRMLANGEAHSSRYRLRHKTKGYIWVMMFGRVAETEAGEMHLHIYYTDATEKRL